MKHHTRNKNHFAKIVCTVLLSVGLMTLASPMAAEAQRMKLFSHNYHGLHSTKQEARAAWKSSARKAANNRCARVGKTFRLHRFTGRITRHLFGVSPTSLPKVTRRRPPGRSIKHKVYGRVLYSCRGYKPR